MIRERQVRIDPYFTYARTDPHPIEDGTGVLKRIGTGMLNHAGSCSGSFYLLMGRCPTTAGS